MQDPNTNQTEMLKIKKKSIINKKDIKQKSNRNQIEMYASNQNTRNEPGIKQKSNRNV